MRASLSSACVGALLVVSLSACPAILGLDNDYSSRSALDASTDHTAGKAQDGSPSRGHDATVPRDSARRDAGSDAGVRGNGDASDAITDARVDGDASADAPREASDGASDACLPGTVRDAGGCAMCGTSLQTCNPGHQWDTPVCESQGGVCMPGATQSQACGNCGTQSQTCQDDCTWGPLGTCGGQGVCLEGTQQCCNFNVSPAQCCVSAFGSAACGANASTCGPCAANGGAWDFYVCDSTCAWFDCTQAGCGNAMCGS